ncbi:Crp/Fnr family transcriptional regulator [Pseudodesulfovibrio sp.]|uniref:Crp/Fnr family transcriptional regulator n=1 Tax=unclassified Pseudodesulfovibrio TaxID=2661612 RepID=UPI003AFFBCB2
MNPPDKEQIIGILCEDANLGLAEHEVLGRLAERTERVHYEKGQYVFRAGDPSTHYYMVESGRVILSKEAPSGKVFTYLIAVRGMTLNAVTCFRPRPRLFSARVQESATLLAIPSEVFSQWVLDCPAVASGILDTMGELLDGAYTRILDIIDESAERRILNALNMLTARIGPDLPLTNADVAEMTGVSRETAARVVSRLQEVGLIAKSRGAIRILNRDQLDELSTSPFFIL